MCVSLDRTSVFTRIKSYHIALITVHIRKNGLTSMATTGTEAGGSQCRRRRPNVTTTTTSEFSGQACPIPFPMSCSILFPHGAILKSPNESSPVQTNNNTNAAVSCGPRWLPFPSHSLKTAPPKPINRQQNRLLSAPRKK